MTEDLIIGGAVLLIVLVLIMGIVTVTMLTGAPRKIEKPKKAKDKKWKEKWLR